MLLKSICKLYNMLPLDTAVYPGHGPETTLRKELEENIYAKLAIRSCSIG
jgi:glyoxylase-like metal-dependent hydrolase (beta-lactamase superfamily II)